MKFSQLKIGDRFHYRNAGYTKTGPLQAVADGSTSAQLIMRSAIVQIPTEKKGSSPSEHSISDQLRRAVDAYHNECKAILESAAVDPGSNRFSMLERLHRELLQTLENIDWPDCGKDPLR